MRGHLMPYLVLDFETTAVQSYGRKPANQFDKRNKVVLIAMKSENSADVETYSLDTDFEPLKEALKNHEVLIGCNIKYDLLFIWHYDWFQDWLKNGGRIWDVMIVEYLLSGQENKYWGLNKLSEKYGGRQKDDNVTQFFEDGFGAEIVPSQLLIPYAEADIWNTELVALEQLKQVTKEKMHPIVKVHMNHHLALCEMEFNGLRFDNEEHLRVKEDLDTQIRQSIVDINRALEKHNRWSLPADVIFNPDSTQHRSAVLFGGEIKYTERRPKVGPDGKEEVFKGGKTPGIIKTRLESTVKKIPAVVESLGDTYSTSLEAGGYWSTDDEILESLSTCGNETLSDIATALRKYRSLITIASKYIDQGTPKKPKGLKDYVGPDGILHPTLDSVNTITGRTISKTPNCQNLPKTVRGLIKSRHEGGSIITADFSQIEIAIYGFLIQSYKFLDEINNGMDFHCKNLALVEGMPYDEVVALCATTQEWKEKRNLIKASVSFTKLYGAHPMTIASRSGLPLKAVEDMFERWDNEYPEAKVFYESIYGSLQKYPRPGPLRIKDFTNKRTIVEESECNHVGLYQGVLGKKYCFTEYAIKTRKGDTWRRFKSNDIENYPIQGTAADVFFLVAGEVYRWTLDKRDKCCLILEVHDELVFDCSPDYRDQYTEEIRGIMENVPLLMKKHFDVNFNVNIKVGMGHGPNWRDAK